MSTQQDIYATGSESHPPMLNKENYVPWSSRLLCYAKSRPNGKLIHNSIINGPYVRRMIPEPGDLNREVLVNETFHVQTDDELTEKELKQIEADDQAIQTILLGLPEDIYTAVNSYEMAQEIWLRVQQMMKASDIGIQEKKARLFNEWERFNSNEGESKEVDELKVERLAKIQDPLALMVIQNAVQNPRVQNIRNQNGLIGIQGIGNQNQIRNGNLVAAHLDEIEEVNANCILMANLQQASISSTQTDKAPVYVSNRSAKNDNDFILEVTSVEQSRETVEQHPANFEETRALYDSLYQNLAIEVEKVNLVNRKLKETNADLTTELARFKNQEKCFEISQEKYDKLKRCYQQSVYQEQCLSKKINALHLSSDKQIMTLNEQISDLNKQLSKEKSTVSFLLEEKKKFKSNFKTHEDELLDKQIHLEKKIKELNNILVKMGQSIQIIHMLSPKTDSFYHTEQKMALGYQNPFYLKQAQKKQQSLYDGKVLLEKHDPLVVHDSEETLQLAQESREKMKQLNKEIKPANYTKINHLLGVFVSQTAKIDDSLAKYKALELEIKRLLRAVVGQDIMSVVQKTFVVDTLNLQTELKRMKERFENRIIKKENEYAKLWNYWYKKCDECKYDKILYDKAYKDMPQKIKRLQAQLGDLKGKSKDTSCVSDTLNHLSQKLKNESDNKHGTSANTKFAKQSIVENLLKVGETHALSKPVTSNSDHTPQESKVVKNDKVITPGMFRINPFKSSMEPKHVPNNEKTTLRPEGHNLGAIQRMIGSPLRLRVVDARIKELKNTIGIYCFIRIRNICHLKKNKADVSIKENQKKHQPKVKKPKKVGFIERLATPKPRKLRFLFRLSRFAYGGCSKHMTGNLELFINFVWKFMGTVRFRNDHVAVIMGFGDLQWGNILITRVYFVEGLGHNLFSVGQFCDSDLEVAFRRNACFVRNLEEVDLLKGDRSTNLYTINLHEMAYASPICLMARASSTKSWLWHQHLSHLNFDTINDLARNDLLSAITSSSYGFVWTNENCQYK
nr:integrase, catalytic region, zinc finger, CCHC-type, peptidase aspartic, catalytic [Tanacetum cinerariifolium]